MELGQVDKRGEVYAAAVRHDIVASGSLHGSAAGAEPGARFERGRIEPLLEKLTLELALGAALYEALGESCMRIVAAANMPDGPQFGRAGKEMILHAGHGFAHPFLVQRSDAVRKEMYQRKREAPFDMAFSYEEYAAALETAADRGWAEESRWFSPESARIAIPIAAESGAVAGTLGVIGDPSILNRREEILSVLKNIRSVV
jgi:DNA-binding IclR family transcriptional regulator